MALPSRQNWPTWARALSSPWLVSPVLVLALLAGGFFGYGAYTRSTPTHYARGGDAFAVPGQSPNSSASHRAATRKGVKPPKGKHLPPLTTAKGGSTGGHSSSGSTSSGGTSTGTGSSGGQTSGGRVHSGSGGGGGGGTTQSSGPVLPATGTYTLAVDGDEHVKFGPFSACHNTFPSRSSLVIKQASGEPAGSYDFDLRFYPNNANKHDERHIYRYTSSGVALSYEQATVTCGGVKQSSEVNYSPNQLRVPANVHVGQSWHNHGGDSARTESGTSKVVGTQNVVIGGRSYPTYVIDTHLSLSGSESGSRDQRWWWSPDLGMPVKWHESLSGRRSGATYSEDVTVTVVSGP